MSSLIERFDTPRLNAIPITEVARRLGEVRRAGSVYKTFCPWHDDRHPSLTLYERTNENRCHCFACGRGGTVIDFVMQHEGWTFQEACRWLCNEFGISSLRVSAPTPVPRRVQLPQPMPKPAESSYTYIPRDMVGGMVSAHSSLCQSLIYMYGTEAVERVAQTYLLGSYAMNGQEDYTVFPNIDVRGRVCNLKVQHYDTNPLSPRFGHSEPDTCRWLGVIWAKEGKLPKDAQFCSACLFGEHLLPGNPCQKVALVESPKNAVFGALEYPQFLWVATGNKGQMKREVLQPLQGRDVIVIPDCDAVADWSAAIHGMADLANFTVSDFCRRMAPADDPKFDIADYIAQQHQATPF